MYMPAYPSTSTSVGVVAVSLLACEAGDETLDRRVDRRV
jgi:hypothetical protein